MAYKILVVDDSLPMRSVIIKTIKASGFGSSEYYQAANGREALEILKNEWLDIVVTDYNMPVMDGMTLIREMKTDDVFNGIPVLVITTEGSQDRVTEFMQAGAAAYIKKPFTPEAVRRKLNQLLGEPDNEEGFENSDEDLDF